MEEMEVEKEEAQNSKGDFQTQLEESLKVALEIGRAHV